MKKYKLFILLEIIGFSQISCDDFVTIDTPDDRIVREVVFSDDQTANSAVIGIYNELFRSDFSNGGISSVTVLGGVSADDLETVFINNNQLIEFENNQILLNNNYNLNLWTSAYNIIYMCNSVLDGLNQYNGASETLKIQLEGEVRFIRAFVYFNLVNLYGNVPLILSPDFRENALSSRSNIAEVYDLIIADLEFSENILSDNYKDENYLRLRPNKYTATALLARVNLYLKNWKQAERLSSIVINRNENYELLQNLDNVFLANSREAIWQISPAGGGELSKTTKEAENFILMSNPILTRETPTVLSQDLINTFKKSDSRLNNWVGKFSEDNLVFYYPFKYKVNRVSEEEIIEYSTVMRLAEQYLIRAEARAQQNKLLKAVQDLDKIRSRANISLLSELPQSIGKEALLDSILIERRRELFTEWGHRWLDLKRLGIVEKVLTPFKPTWQNTDVLYPIPEDEIIKNPNIQQNPGY